MENNLFRAAKNEAAYLKLGLYGGSGSGKTYTSSLVAIGLSKMIKSKKSVFFLDSETGSDYVLPLFKREGVELQVAKSRAFQDLLEAVDIAEENGSILIVDSITHYWDELVESYKKKKNLKRMFIQHWQEVKPTWREFSEKFVASRLHIILCGRAGDVWSDVEDSEGVKELKKVGTKMRVEKETSYEPSLLIEMEKAIKEKGWTHRAFVEKDRFDIIDLKVFDNPKFEDLLPHIELLNLGGSHMALDTDRNSQDMFEKGNTGAEYHKTREQTCEEIKNEINLLFVGRDGKTTNDKNLYLKELFGTHSWSKICGMDVAKLMNGLTDIEALNKKKNEFLSGTKTEEIKNEKKDDATNKKS